MEVFTVFFDTGLVCLKSEACLEVRVKAFCDPVRVFAALGGFFSVGQAPFLGVVDLVRHGFEKRRKGDTRIDLFVSTAGHGVGQIKRNLGFAFFGAL